MKGGHPHRMPHAIIKAALLSGALASTPMAGERTEEAAFFEDLPTVLTLSRMPQSTAEAPEAVTAIGPELIRASGARTIPDLLRLVPGFYVAFKNAHFASVTHHGYTDDYSRRMQVLIDGRSVFTPYFVGGVDWMSLPITIQDIDTIEVVRGTNSAAFGSNAFLGVVNIITKSAAPPSMPTASPRATTLNCRMCFCRFARCASPGARKRVATPWRTPSRLEHLPRKAPISRVCS